MPVIQQSAAVATPPPLMVHLKEAQDERAENTGPRICNSPDKTFIHKDTCTTMFIAALFTIARTWKQPKCPSTDDSIQKRWYIYTMEYYSAIKKNDIMPFAATWMELENLILSEMSQKDKDKCHMISLITGM